MISPITLPIQAPQKSPTGEQAFINPQTNAVANREQAFQGFEAIKQERYNSIFAHEMLHKSAGGSQVGGIVIETDTNGVAVGGHVPIRMPGGVDKANPEKTYKEAEVAYRAASAPGGDMSSADKSIAARAHSLMSMSQSQTGNCCGQGNGSLQKGKKLNIMA
ncbi:MAG: hypothetical protein ACD_20C00225G0027 [uncultured bacterium]|nr:MAG: hypothetical protein ACD_20C00225G0027 [uncultured bacterium]HBH18219.1 hypothetical protein [Cyanobacteria bacterium UBA9579]